MQETTPSSEQISVIENSDFLKNLLVMFVAISFHIKKNWWITNKLYTEKIYSMIAKSVKNIFQIWKIWEHICKENTVTKKTDD